MLLLLRLEKFASLRWREFFWKIKKWSTKNAVSFFDFENVRAVSRRTKEGYLVELEIPMKKRLHELQLLGFNFTVMDHGNAPKPNQGLSLSKSACWNNVLAFELLQLKTEKGKQP